MKSIMLALILCFFAFESRAQSEKCLLSLSSNYSRDMAVFHLNGSAVEEYAVLNEQMAVHVVEVLLKNQTECSMQDLGPKIVSECKSFGSNVVCEVKSGVGYFIVHRGSFGHFEHSITWARWD
jgi:hypothetical protein